jgi:hypothetical protein
MTTIELTARVSETGELKVQLPAEFRSNEVRVRVEALEDEQDQEKPWEERPWTREEIEELLQPNPQTGSEIAKSPAIGSWSHLGIEDSAEYVEQLRRQRKERHQWPKD